MPTNEDREILELEHAYWRAIQERDLDAALALTDETCIVIGAQGFAKIGGEQFAQMLRSDRWALHGYEIVGEPAIRRVGDDLAFVAYKVREEMTVEGKPLVLEAADSSTWIRRDGKWRCALHTESVLGDPFGRDRLPAASKGDAARQAQHPRVS